MKRFAFTVLFFLLFVSVIPVFADISEGAEFAGYEVTFIVVNGTFDDGISTVRTVTLAVNGNDAATVSKNDIPTLRPINKDYTGGSWVPDLDYEKGTDIYEDTVFTYTFAHKTPISYEVTFKAVNGTFNGSRQQIKLTLNGYKEDEVKLGDDQIPEVGEPNEGYKPGSWDADVRAGTEITGDTTFTYTYAQKGRISYEVVFSVNYGIWDDGMRNEKEVTLEGFEDETLTLRAEDIPSAGSKPNPGYQAGSWDRVPTPDTVIIKNMSYQYNYVQIPSIEQRVEPLTAVPARLTGIYENDLNALEQALLDGLKIHGQSAQIDQTLFVDVQASVDGGIEWKSSIGADLLPEGGLRVDIPYPKGTGRDTHDFGVSHMFGETNEKLGINAGGIEYPPVRLLEDHLSVVLKGLSPMAISWRAKSSMDLPVNFVLLHSDGTRGVPFDIKEGTLRPVLTIKKGDEAVAKSEAMEVEITAGMPNEVPDKKAYFSNKVDDLGPGKYEVSVSGLPKEMEKEVPDSANKPKYKLTAKAEINLIDKKDLVITVYLIWEDMYERVEPVVYALPEDEIGAYWITKDGTKEYLLFHTYDICMQWLGSEELCEGPKRCFHKDGK